MAAIAKALREHARRLSLDHTDGTVSASQLRDAAANAQEKPATIVEQSEEEEEKEAESPVKAVPTDKAKCYKCSETGHYAYDCPHSNSESSSAETSAAATTSDTPTTPATSDTPASPPNMVAEHINLTNLSLDSESEPPGLYNDISRSESEEEDSSDDSDDSDDGDSDDGENKKSKATLRKEERNSPHGKSLSMLYTKNRTRMNELTTKLNAAGQQTGDDLWLLRYVLSFEHMDDAVAAASLSNEWRAQSGIADMIEDVSKNKFFQSELAMHVHKYLCCGTHGTMKNGGGPVFIIRAGLSRPSLLMDRLTKADVSYYLLAQREKMFQRCDALSRKTNTLVKGTMIIDLENASLAEIWNESRFRDVNAAVSHLSGSLYPQMTHKTVIVNPPSYFSWLFSVISRLVTKRLTKKIIIIPKNQLFMKSYFVKQHLIMKDIPNFLGGAEDNSVASELTGDLVHFEEEWYRDIQIR